MNAPCKDCIEREMGCHSKCERYARFKENDAKRKSRSQQIAKAAIQGFVVDSIERVKRQRKIR